MQMSDSIIQGKYLSDVFLIEFPAHVKVFTKAGNNQGPKTQNDYATFVHEYWHFLLKISTVVRFRDFSIWHQLIPIFTKALTDNADGTSEGNSLSAEDKILLDEFTELIFTYNGDCFEGLKGKKVKDYKVIGNAVTEDCNLTLKGKPISYKKVKIPVEVLTEQGIEQIHYVLGNSTIDESIANSIDKIIFAKGNIPPAIPYLMLEKMSKYYNGGISLTNYELSAIGTLSFLTTNPAFSLEALFKDYINLRKITSIEKSLLEICNRIKPEFMKIASVLLNDLQSIQDVYKGREPTDFAIDYIANRIRNAIDLRLTNLLFDLKPFENGVLKQETLNKLIFEIIPPCDIRQKFEGDFDIVNRDIILSFDLKPINLNGNIIYSSYLLQVLNCQMDFFRAHWAFYSIMDSDKVESVCPYYTSCDLEQRINEQDICKLKPWKSFKRGQKNCMYGSAVASMIGIVKIRNENEAL